MSFNVLINPAEIGPLGMADGSISDSQITASSVFSKNNRYSYEGRLNNNNYWATAEGQPSNPWIQVAFSSPVTIAAIQTQGASGYQYWVTKLQVQTGDSETTLSYILDPGNGQAFVRTF